MRPFDWAQLISAVGFFTLAVVHILALRLPRFGRWALGPEWPGHFTDSVRKRLKTRRWMLQSTGYALFGLSLACRPMVALFTASDRAATIAGLLSLVPMLLAVACILSAFFLDRPL